MMVSRENAFASSVITCSAVAQDGDPIRDLQRLFERVTDEDDRNLIAAQPVDQRKQMMLFFRRQRCGRLVENDDFRF